MGFTRYAIFLCFTGFNCRWNEQKGNAWRLFNEAEAERRVCQLLLFCSALWLLFNLILRMSLMLLLFSSFSRNMTNMSSHLGFLINIWVESQLTRRTPSSYADGVYMMAGVDRPSPRYLSQVVMKGEDGLGSARNLTTIFAFFGEYAFSFLLEDVIVTLFTSYYIFLPLLL